MATSSLRRWSAELGDPLEEVGQEFRAPCSGNFLNQPLQAGGFKHFPLRVAGFDGSVSEHQKAIAGLQSQMREIGVLAMFFNEKRNFRDDFDGAGFAVTDQKRPGMPGGGERGLPMHRIVNQCESGHESPGLGGGGEGAIQIRQQLRRIASDCGRSGRKRFSSWRR